MTITLAIAICTAFTSLNVAILLAIRFFDKRNTQDKLEELEGRVVFLEGSRLLLDCMQCVKGTSYDKPGVNWKGEPINDERTNSLT